MSHVYTEDLVLANVAGTTISTNDIITTVFHVEDFRYVVVDVQGGLTNFKLQGRVGEGTWRDIKTQASGTRLVFTTEGDSDLLDDQLRVMGLAGSNVDNVWVTRMR